MRQPGRLRISWQDDTTLKLEFDAGTQTRLLNFDRGDSRPAEKTWQGFSLADWQGPGVGRGGERPPVNRCRSARGARCAGAGRRRSGSARRSASARPGAESRGASLKVVTTQFREGYLRKNGVPYSEQAIITEYFHRLPTHPNGDDWLHVVTDRRGPALPVAAVLHEHALQARGRRLEVEPDAVRDAAPPLPVAQKSRGRDGSEEGAPGAPSLAAAYGS